MRTFAWRRAGASIRPLDAPTLDDGQDTQGGSAPRRESNSRYARAVLPPGRNGFECQVVDQVMLRLPGSQEDERYGTMAFSISAPPFWPKPDGRIRSAGTSSKS